MLWFVQASWSSPVELAEFHGRDSFPHWVNTARPPVEVLGVCGPGLAMHSRWFEGWPKSGRSLVSSRKRKTDARINRLTHSQSVKLEAIV